MSYLLDTNILVRLARPSDPLRPVALHALAALRRTRDAIFTCPQILYEFHVVATRPVAQNGLGMTAAQAAVESNGVLVLFRFAPDAEDVFTTWRELVKKYDVRGKQGHDARIVAAMLVHGITSLLTFNAADFSKYTEINVVAPASFAAS